MIIEEFIVYEYNKIFYKKEELEEIGFCYIEDKNEFENIREKNRNYIVAVKQSNNEENYTIDEYLKKINKNFNGEFFCDFGENGIVLELEKHYGLIYKCGNQIRKQLFCSKESSIHAQMVLEKKIEELFDDFHNRSALPSINNEYIRQEQEKITRQKVLSFANKSQKNDKKFT